MLENQQGPYLPYHKGLTRTRLLQQARLLIEETGDLSPSLRELSRRCGVSATTAYRHFSGKEEILAVLGEQLVGEIVAAVDAASRDTPLTPLLLWAKRNPRLWRFLLSLPKGPPSLAVLSQRLGPLWYNTVGLAVAAATEGWRAKEEPWG